MNTKLQYSYGEMIIPKGTILYHRSKKPFQINIDKSMLFTTFHPDDWPIGDYITKIKIKKNLSLFFMIHPDIFYMSSIHSLLDLLIIKDIDNVWVKQQNNYLEYFKNKLKKENFDGWFSTIEDKTNVEICLINDLNNYKVIYPSKNTSKYCRITNKPIKIKLNKKYEKFVENYTKFSIKDNYYFPFQKIFKNASIEYNDKAFIPIIWN